MTKAELVTLIAEHTAGPLGVKFDASSLDDWIKDGLVPPGRRNGNIGRRPNFEFTWRHVHRVRFLVMLKASGVTSRDAQRLRLYVAGCSLLTWEVRDALLGEYRHAVARLNNQVRSGYLDNWKSLTPTKVDAIAREIGPADADLRAGGLTLPTEAIIPIMRGARQSPIQPIPGDLSPKVVARLSSGNFSMADLTPLAERVFAGTLLVGAASNGANANDSIEALILNADDQALRNLRHLFRILASMLGSTGLLGSFVESSAPAGTREKMLRTIKRSPEYIAFNLAQGLRFAVELPFEFSAAHIQLMRWLLANFSRVSEIQSAPDADAQRELIQKESEKFKGLGDSSRREIK